RLPLHVARWRSHSRIEPLAFQALTILDWIHMTVFWVGSIFFGYPAMIILYGAHAATEYIWASWKSRDEQEVAHDLNAGNLGLRRMRLWRRGLVSLILSVAIVVNTWGFLMMMSGILWSCISMVVYYREWYGVGLSKHSFEMD